MTLDPLVEAELENVSWHKVQQADGTSETIPNHFRSLLVATTFKEIESAYWNLENHVVVQGHVYEASLYIVPAICAALTDPTRSLLVRTWLLELLFQICDGFYQPTDACTASPPDIIERCRNEARKALWVLYREFARQEIKIVESLIRVLETDPTRLQRVIDKLPNYKPPVWLPIQE